MVTFLPELTLRRMLFSKTESAILEVSLSSSTPNETGEEVFQKLREAIAQITSEEISRIKRESLLNDLFPKKGRRKKIKELKRTTGYTIQFLRPNIYFYYLSGFLLLVSVGTLFLNGLYGLTGIFMTSLLHFIAQETGIEFTYPTVGQVAEKITIDQLN